MNRRGHVNVPFSGIWRRMRPSNFRLGRIHAEENPFLANLFDHRGASGAERILMEMNASPAASASPARVTRPHLEGVRIGSDGWPRSTRPK
jgi:hypothetical protein